MKSLPALILSLSMVLPSNPLYAADLDFAAFYKKSSGPNWTLIVLGSLVVGGAVLATGGAGTPFVASVGTLIGNSMGLSGIAATNAGLALLGGGSIASGGFGVAGGSAVLATMIELGGGTAAEIILQGNGDNRDYKKMAENSLQLPTLNFPTNETDSEDYRNYVRKLNPENSISEDAVGAAAKKDLIISVINDIHVNRGRMRSGISSQNMSQEEVARSDALLSVLYFINGDYEKAKESALDSLNYASEQGEKHSLPSFIYATSVLYDENFSFTENTFYNFRSAVLEDPEDPFIPVMFSIYLDRMLARLAMNDDAVKVSDLNFIYQIMRHPDIDDEFLERNFVVMLSRYITVLEIEKGRAKALATSSNDSLRNSPAVKQAISQSLSNFNQLLSDSQFVIDGIDAHLEGEQVTYNSCASLSSEDRSKDVLQCLVNYWRTLAAEKEDLSSLEI